MYEYVYRDMSASWKQRIVATERMSRLPARDAYAELCTGQI